MCPVYSVNYVTGLYPLLSSPSGRGSEPPQADLLCATIVRMRILHICSARSIGGGEKHVASLANSLAQQGHDVFVALAPDSPLRVLLQDVPRDHIIELPMRNALSLGSAWKLARFARSR